MSVSFLDAVIRLAAAALLSGVIGFEREFQKKPAGLRTHMLVGMGSALFAIVSLSSFEALDPSRIAAGVVTGVGFLGAGAIFREGQFVRGLTTAAGLWVVAGIGLAAGAGDIGLAAVASGVALTVLLVLGALESYLGKKKGDVVQMQVLIADEIAIGKVMKLAERHDPELGEVSFETSDDERVGTLVLHVSRNRAEVVAAMLAAVDGVSGVEVG
ncbi:MAG: MgtC/SapB family protein [Acidimicrobiia bacterium]